MAEFLLQNGYNLDAMDLSGYAIECSLKALILEVTAESEQPKIHDAITRGSGMHKPEVLAGMLSDRGRPIPADLRRRFRRFGGTVSLRYKFGRGDTGEARGSLRTAKRIVDGVEGQLP